MDIYAQGLSSRKKVVLVTDDRYFYLGIKSASLRNLAITALGFDRFMNESVSADALIVIDMLSWAFFKSSNETSFYEKMIKNKKPEDVVMLTSNIFQEVITDMLYPGLCKVDRKLTLSFFSELSASKIKKNSARWCPAFAKKRGLTNREMNIILELFRGGKEDEISMQLNICQKTVSAHKLSALSKVGCKNISHFFLLGRPFYRDLKFLLSPRRNSLSGKRLSVSQ
ncbi:helix-turn-helix domain-containing protein [Erwinia amylovora]|uniref:Activator of exopolysaccharide synthesis n=4 Tax=Erwinia amylovora TaxID=552 RepID=A0A831A5I2_ERWAM|nr:helix-turn-helix transcriptional regulator [Erwinia amylovora]CBX81683.1 activator of exopolysaccharide synthesis [Erwinia amylovora ATCC BAA-2158]CDK16186.1 activator of exopolysaccharide synthesis [Erwinia amylovora LA635]CDK19552.1 activator of exopolysaccharide synthesis [Erwinia amylovora LA636]CDK22924.1 activator of exopolysaccharide synthesis [Erwinia amylovora LA637]ATZ10690.1 LuxR family transcriptional regulator [Erwinia amylovora]